MTNRIKYLFAVVPLMLVSSLWSQTGATPPAPGVSPAAGSTETRPASTTSFEQPPVAFSERNPRYRLTPGDSVDLSFKFSPEFNQANVKVQPDGFVTLEGVGDVHIAGLTMPELTQILRQAYSKILKNPDIQIRLQDFNKPYFVVTGQVTRPGKYELREATSLTQAIAIAGGFNEAAKHSQVWLFRRQSDGTVQSRETNVKSMLGKGRLQEDIALQPGDMIWVPQNTWSKVKGVLAPTTGVIGATGGIAPGVARPLTSQPPMER